MESKYWLELDVDTCGYRSSDMDGEKSRAAVSRLQKKIAKGDTIVAIHVKNPRYSGSF
jgi:hypothetical protein